MEELPLNDNANPASVAWCLPREAKELLERCLAVLNADPYLRRTPLAYELQLFLDRRV